MISDNPALPLLVHRIDLAGSTAAVSDPGPHVFERPMLTHGLSIVCALQRAPTSNKSLRLDLAHFVFPLWMSYHCLPRSP